MYASARDITRDAAGRVRPPARKGVALAVRRSMRVVSSDGTTKDWDPGLTPYMVEPMDLLPSRAYEAIVLIGPARSGKTIALIDGAMAYTIADDPADTLIVQTNQKQAEDYSKTRVNRSIKFSPDLKAQLSPRAHDDNVLMKFFRKGMSLRIGWPSFSVLSGKDVKRVLMTDVDNFSGDLGIDEAFGLAMKRVQTFMSAGIVVAESSPAVDYEDAEWVPSTRHEAPPAAGICALYNQGDRRRWYWPCPECKEHFEAAPGLGLFALPTDEELLERVLVEDTYRLAQRFALVTCPHCGSAIDHRWKRSMNSAGRWVGELQRVEADGTVIGSLPVSRIASFYLGGVAAAYQPWDQLLERYFKALKTYATTGASETLKTTVNVDQAIPFLPMALRTKRAREDLQARKEEWMPDEVPEGVRFLTATVDVQGNRFVIQVMGWSPSADGLGVERWLVDTYALKTSARPDGAGGFLPLEPAAYLEDWERLTEKVVQRRYPLGDGSGRTMPVRFVAIDSQGAEGTAPRALDYWRKLRQAGLGGRVRLLRGEASKNAALIREGFPDARKRSDRHSGAVGDVPMLFLQVDRLKDMVSANLQRTETGPGYYHLPSWLPQSFFKELTAEVRTESGWKNPSKRRNEQFDLAGYNEALGIRLRVGAINWEAPPPWAAPWDQNPEVLAANEEAPLGAAAPRRAPRIIRSRYMRR